MRLRHPRLIGALLASVGVLAGTALYVHMQARRAERENPPMGRFLEIDGVRLHYVERGKGQPLVLLHGNGAMVEDWAVSGVLERAAENYRVIAFDRPGFGHSERPRNRLWTPDAQARLLWEAMRRLGIERPIVVGHSWGTMVALAMALDHQSAIERVVLLSGFYFPQPRADVLMSVPAVPVVGDVMRYTVSPLSGKLLEGKMMKMIFAPNPVPPRFAARFPMELALRPSQIRAAAADTALMIPGAAALSARYRPLSVPVAIIAGTGDQIVNTRKHSVRLHEALPGSTLHLVQGAGHMVHYVAQDRILDAIAGR